MIIGTIILMLLVISVGSYAWLTWSSDNTSLTLSIGELQVMYEHGNDINVSGIGPVVNYNDGEATTFRVINNTGKEYLYNIYIGINSISDSLKVDSFKYMLLTSKDGINYSEYETGSFNDIVENKLSVVNSGLLTGGKTYFKLFIYIDGMMENPVNMMNNSLKATVNIGAEEFTGVNDGKSLAAVIKNRASDSTPDFSQVATTDEGVFKAYDDYGISYYYRGAVTNNYVQFGKYASDVWYGYNLTSASNIENESFVQYDSESACNDELLYSDNCTKMISAGDPMYWRIVRINGDGSIRMVYDGTTPHDNGVITSNSMIGYSSFNNKHNNNTYVGYMYGDIAGSTYETVHVNTYDSMIKGSIDNWYNKHLRTSYGSKLADVVFCGDRSLDNVGNYAPLGTGVGKAKTSYGAHYRMYNTKTPNLVCFNANDKYTVNVHDNDNGVLDYPISLLSVDELTMAGGVFGNDKVNSSYYLYNGNDFYSMTPSAFSGASGFVWYVGEQGNLDDNVNIVLPRGIRPVVNLLPTVNVVSGDGSKGSPYVIG